MRAKRSMRAAIDAMCKSCIYDPIASLGTLRQQVEACTASNCPLFEYRPISESERYREMPPQGESALLAGENGQEEGAA